jgi:YfiH family protein
LRQVHGADVVFVDRPGAHAGDEADAAVTASPGAALVVRTADCAPVAFLSADAVGLAHAGWRGLLGGVVERTADALRSLGASSITARIGPCISAGAYEFGHEDLDAIAAVYGDGVRGTAASGAPGLDLAAGIRVALERCGVALEGPPPACTASRADDYFSHRARRETGRQPTFVWLER